MVNGLTNHLLKPLLERLGTAAAVWLLTAGQWVCDNWQACGLVTAEGANQVMTWVVAAALVAVDLVVAEVRRRGDRRKAVADARDV